MKRVTGIGGIFFKAKDAPAMQAWYKRHLGIDVQEWGGAAFTWTDGDGKPVGGTTIWSIGSAQGEQFAPSTATFMINYRVGNLERLQAADRLAPERYRAGGVHQPHDRLRGRRAARPRPPLRRSLRRSGRRSGAAGGMWFTCERRGG